MSLHRPGRVFIHRTLGAFSLLTSLILLPQAMAQEPAGEIERITTTASRAQVSQNNLPMVVSTVTADELNRLSLVHIEEALKYIAGAGVQRGNGQEYLPALRSPVFTGAGACGGILTAEDGIPLRAAGFCNINELFEAHSEMAQRLEVLKGPASVLYGSNAIHGVVNVITPDTTYGGGMAGIDYGSYGYNRYKLRAGRDFGASGIGINASVTRDSGYRDEEGVDQEKANVRHRLELGDISVNTGLTYTNLDQDTAGYISGFQSYKNKALAQGNENPEAFRDASALRLWSELKWRGENGRTLTVTPYLRDQNMDFLMHFLPGKPLEKNSQHGAGIQSLWQQPLSSTVELQAGLDAEFTRGSLSQYQDGPTEGSAFLQETIPQGKHYDYDVDATLYAPFFNLQWQRNAWLLSAGVRYEHMKYDYENRMLAGRTRENGTECGFGGCRYSRPESREDSFSNLSEKLGMVYRFSPQASLYANVARGYRAPQATELYRLQREQQVADLEPETVTSLEVGMKGFYKTWRYIVSAYHMEKDNVIFRDSNFFNVDDGETRHQGVELELFYTFSEQWDVAVATTYAKHTYTHDQNLGSQPINGNDIDTAPRFQANSLLGWNLTDTTRLMLEWQHVGRYYTDPENLHEYEGHDVFHFRAQFAVNNELTLLARIDNVTNEAYAERADFTEFGGDRYFPGRPRNFMLSIQYQWN